MGDLQRELDRNAAATRMAMAREVEAQAAKKRAEASQQKMSEMMAKYETMKAKLDATKGSLDAKQKQITNQAALTEKITAMKERVEQYAAKKEAVSALTEHVAIRQVLQQNKLDVVNEELDQEDDNSANAARLGLVKTGLKEHTERMQILQRNMAKNAETMAKREQLKEMLEKQVLLEEKRTVEQNKIAEAREKLLEMKMRELELQKAKMERTKREQEERKKATNDFMAGVEAELEEMEAKAKAPLLAEREKQLGAVPKQGKKGKGKKSKGNTPKVMSPEPKTPKVQSPEPKTPKVMSPEPAEKEKGQLDAALPKSERKEAIMRRMEQMEKEQGKREKEKMTEEEVKQMVENVEGKCKTVKSDMADMAMTEQYLRTKQALLMAKKKEQEMKVAANIAAIREREVQKMRDKVKCMQDLLASRKAKLKITEEILVEKGDQKKHLDKDVEKMKRRESYVEKELIDRKIFENEAPKKK